MKIVWLNRQNEERATTRADIGGKACRLYRLAQAGLPVPPAFCIPADSMDGLDACEIEAAMKKLAAASFAVRSSAAEEDENTMSFAGIYTTRLNVCSVTGVVEALAAVRASATLPAAAAYRKKRGVQRPPRMAGIVQHFVNADASGVLFMKDPVGRSRTVVIEGSWGLGEAVVSGRVSPDRWILSRDGTLMHCTVADKDIAVVAARHGTKEIQLAPGRRKRPCLTELAVGKLFELAAACEALFGSPQDIEWAVTGDEIWLLQSRPITA